MNIKRVLAFIAILLAPAIANAAMTISGTRIIFPGNQKEQIVRTNNKGSKPALVQVWVDDGSTNKNINEMKVPFLPTPPVYRVEPGKGQSVRLIYNGMTLPQDRESVFWFNMMEIPTANKDAENVPRLELAFNTRIKIFYRPINLTSSSSSEFTKLTWELYKQGEGLTVGNPTPYYFSFESGYVLEKNQKFFLKTEMIPPFSSRIFLLESKGRLINKSSQNYLRLINDFGAASEIVLKYKNNAPIVEAVIQKDN
ncbi:fimbria/pilus periplasmic chaperone [Pantoea sp.]|uniref:fimbrial biogenesis chaperone n=1 Tax=Pantoea sp. TaxID=69393 RepID=UPI00289FF0F0|nr:fimbria/pilus periplasmic chaperone [Pantoea sp.]